MKTYIIGIILLSLTGCTSVHTNAVKVNMNRHQLQEDRMDRLEAKAESHGKEM